MLYCDIILHNIMCQTAAYIFICISQIGDESPDVDPAALKAAWTAVQALVDQRLISAGHDISDGGIATTLLEMAFAGEWV